jgi:hypothetical protein
MPVLAPSVRGSKPGKVFRGGFHTTTQPETAHSEAIDMYWQFHSAGKQTCYSHSWLQVLNKSR